MLPAWAALLLGLLLGAGLALLPQRAWLTPALCGAAARCEKVLPDRPVEAHVTGYGDSAVNYVLRFWARTEDYWDAYNDVMDRMKSAFDTAGVSMTYPHINVHMGS